MRKLFTLCLVHTDNKLLLGKKKKGFGEGLWNGFGGKIEFGETPEDAMRREVKEEAGVEVVEYENAGILEFAFQDSEDVLEVHVWRAGNIVGEPKETEEMSPVWFDVLQLPLKEMWPDDPFWLPLFLEKKRFEGKFLLSHLLGDTQVVEHDVKELL